MSRARYAAQFQPITDLTGRPSHIVRNGHPNAVACPACGAAVGHQCTSATGLTANAHRSRRRLAARLINGGAS